MSVDENQCAHRLRFAFLTDDYHGHAIPLMGIARKLVALNHSVCFFGPGAIRQYVLERGFRYVSLPYLLPRVFPKSTMDSEGRRTRAEGQARVSMRAQEILAGIRRLKREYPADLAVFDPFMLCHLPAFIDNGIKSVSVSISPLLVQDIFNPPYTCSVVPGKERFWAVKAPLAWGKQYLKYARYRAYCLRKDWHHGWSNLSLIKELSALTGFRLKDELVIRGEPLDLRFRSIPELVVHAREFEFPRKRPPGGLGGYIGPCIDAPDPPLSPQRLPGGNGPLIYCHLGTVESQQNSTAVLGYRRLLELLRSEPGWRAIIVTASPSISSAISAEVNAFGERVALYDWANQALLLRDADVAVTHAGDASVKEAIQAGTPMLALPRQHDQPGVAARIAYHGLGVKADPLICADGMRKKIALILADRKFEERVGAMRTIFSRYETEKICERILIDAARGVMPSFQNECA